jgi:hypothetical protein
VKPLSLLFYRPEDGERRWMDIVKDIPNHFESYVQGAMYYEDEGHLVAMEKTKK